MKINKEFVFNVSIIIILWSLEILDSIILKNISFTEYRLSISLFTITILISSLLIYYLNYVVFIPKFIIRKKYLKYILSFITMSFLFAAVRFF